MCCYNGAMVNWSFQFSMRRMMGAIALLGVAARLGSLFIASRFNPSISQDLLFFGFFAAGGAGIGCFGGRPFVGAFCGIALGMFIGELFFWHVSWARE
jgi:hypothetical protein